MTAFFIEGGTALAAVDRWCVDTHAVTEYLPDSVRVAAGLPSFLRRRWLVQHVWDVRTLLCHICRSNRHVLHRQDAQTKVNCCGNSLILILVFWP